LLDNTHEKKNEYLFSQKKNIFFFNQAKNRSFLRMDEYAALSNLPKSYCDYDSQSMKAISDKYDFELLMDAALKGKHVGAQRTILMMVGNSLGPYKYKTIEQRLIALSNFWQKILDAKANVEETCNGIEICLTMREIIFEDCFYHQQSSRPEHLQLGCDFIRNLPCLSDDQRKWMLQRFQDIFKQYEE
jgi:hypothetical protein